MLTTNVLLYVAVNLAGMYTKYLTDRGQRQAFLETHRSMETRQRTQNENNRQEKLLLSGIETKIDVFRVLSVVARSLTITFVNIIFLREFG